MQVLWESGVITEYFTKRARHVSGIQVDAATEDRLRCLVEQGHHDDDVADILNREATRTGTGKHWDAHAVARVRYRLRVARPGSFPANKALPTSGPTGCTRAAVSPLVSVCGRGPSADGCRLACSRSRTVAHDVSPPGSNWTR